MQAVQLLEEKGPDGRFKLAVRSTPLPTLAPASPSSSATTQAARALVSVRCAALNHRDNWMTAGLYPRMRFGGTLGSDGCGVVSAASDTSEAARWVGRRVVVDPSLGWGAGGAAPASGFSILGMPEAGTLASAVSVPTANLRAAPAHLSDEEAAALPLAGGTAWRAVFTKGEAKAGSAVLVTGIGGGVALLALQFAAAAGCAVYVTSSSEAKLARARELGACCGVNYAEKGWAERLRKEVRKRHRGFDCVVDGAGGKGLNEYLRMMKAGGRVVSYGSTAGPPKPLAMAAVFLNNVEIRGTAMCSPAEFTAMLKFVEKHEIRPVVDSVYALEDTEKAVAKMRAGKQFGKIVVRVAAAASKL